MTESTPFEHPKRVGPYHILHVIGEGGMGIVYAAAQKEPLERRVALELIKIGMDTREIVTRFASERYMSPAQLLDGASGIDTRTDIYALGVLGAVLEDPPGPSSRFDSKHATQEAGRARGRPDRHGTGVPAGEPRTMRKRPWGARSQPCPPEAEIGSSVAGGVVPR